MLKKGLFLILAVTLILFSLPAIAIAKEPSTPRNFELKKGEIVEHDLLVAGETVNISGTVNGDVYAAGANITVDGKINGDLLVGGGMINILGEVSDDVRVGGGNILINGTIGKNLTVGGGTVMITNEAKIGGSLLAGVGNLELRGPVGKEANIYAGRALINSQIGRDLSGSMEELVLSSEARVGGDLDYLSPNEAEIADGAVISGETTYKPSKKVKPVGLKPKFLAKPDLFRGAGLWLSFSSFLLSFLLGWGFLRILPKRNEEMAKVLTAHPWQSLGVGFLTMILFPLGIVFLAITIIGLPFVLMLIPLFLFLLYFSKIFVAIGTGRWILNRFEIKKSWSWALLVGLAAYYLLRQIPFISPAVALAFTVLGLGVFILDQKRLRTAK